MWFKSLIIDGEKIIDGIAINSFRLQNTSLDRNEQLLINLVGYDWFNRLVYLTDIKIYRCCLDFSSRTGYYDLNQVRSLLSSEKQSIEKAIGNTLSRKVRQHSQTQLTLQKHLN